MTVDPYLELKTALAEANSDISASELHGVLTGLVIAKQEDAAENPDELVRLCGLPSSTNEAFLNGIRDWMNSMLASFEDISRFDFQPLLPDDSDPLAERTEALGDWIKGLQLGISSGGLTNPAQQLSADGSEIWDDLQEIGNIEPAREESEEAEAQWISVLEYVRVGTYTLAQDFCDIRGNTDEAADADSDYSEVYAEYIDDDENN